MSLQRATRAVVVAVTVFLLFGARMASAQTLTSGAVGGVVRDSAGTALVDVSVTLVGISTGATRTTATGQDGSYRFMLVTPGDYEVILERIGFRPVRVQGVAVNDGQRLSVGATLAVERPPVRAADVVRLPGAGHERPGISDWIPGSLLAAVPSERRDLTQVARLSSQLGPDLSAEGLPASRTGLALDGMRFEVARHPAFPGLGLSATLPLLAVASADYVGTPVDAEWQGAPGGLLEARTPVGTPNSQVRAFGRWSVPSLVSSPNFDTKGLSLNDGDGGVLITGPVTRDSAFFSVGVEARHSERAFAGLWSPGTGADLLQVAKDSFGLDLASYTRPRVVKSDALSAFGRFDWQLTPQHGLDARAVFTRVPRSDDGAAPSLGLAPTYQGNDFVASAGVRSLLGEATANELRLGFDASTRDFGATGGAAATPLTVLAASSLAFGDAAAGQGHFRQSTFRLRETFLHDLGMHHLRLGLDASATAYQQAYRYGGAGIFYFGGVGDLAARRGVFMQPTGTGGSGQFSLGRYAAFFEDSWAPTPGTEILLGLRAQLQRLPQGAIAHSPVWDSLSGLSNTFLPGRTGALNPRLGLTWDVQDRHEWVLRAGASLDEDPFDPAVMAELVNLDGSIHVRRGVGTLAGWPNLPATVDAPPAGASLSLLAPGFRSPRTARLSGGLSRALGGGAALQLSATYRHTDFLPTRADINTVAQPVATDPNGRPLYGGLRQVGSLLTAVPGSSRRFSGFDAVWALQSNAASDYWGITAGVDGLELGPLQLTASYTRSAAKDDWPSAWGVPTGAFAPGIPDLTRGPADYDVPDRVVVGAQLHAPLGLRLAGLYRYRSGLPFTPGFAAGVDANADGSLGNDPAFVDAALPGMSDLISQFSCLRSQQGRFAGRNSCRAPGVHSLDARLALSLFRVGGSRLEATVDGLNLVQSDAGFVDAALLQLDPAGTLAGTRAPWVANPHFGASLAPQLSGRVFRLGLSLNW